VSVLLDRCRFAGVEIGSGDVEERREECSCLRPMLSLYSLRLVQGPFT